MNAFRMGSFNLSCTTKFTCISITFQAMFVSLSVDCIDLHAFYHKQHGCPLQGVILPLASHNCAVWDGTWKLLRSAAGWVAEECSLDFPLCVFLVTAAHKNYYLLNTAIHFLVSVPVYRTQFQ
jgi:hypothetical protein